MVQAAIGDTGRPPAAKANGRKGALRAMPDEPAGTHAIPLDLAELLAPYKRQGRLALRIERLPVLSRLSRGRNNGDGSWSLGLDELENLEFLAPAGSNGTYALAIRIIACGAGDASTIALLDFPVSCGTVLPDSTGIEAVPAMRESKRTGSRQKSMQGQNEAAAKFAFGFERERAAGKAREEARIAELELHASEQLAEARKTWFHESKSELAKAENAWKAAEATRFAAAEAQWKEKSVKELAEVRASTFETRSLREAELQRLRGQLAEAEAALAERERELIAARSAVTEAASRALEEKAAALSQAEEAWKADEAMRLAECKTRWQKDADGTMAAVTRRCETAETALAEMTSKQKRSEAAGAADSDRERDRIRQLGGELVAARTALAAREEEIAQLRAAKTEALERLEREATAAEARAQERFAGALDEATARYEAAEQALAEMRERANSVQDRNDPTLRRLHDEIARSQAVLADREVELARLRTELERVRAHQRSDAIASYREHVDDGDQDKGANGQRGLFRDVVLVVAVVMSAIVFYPSLEAQFRGFWTAGDPANAVSSPAPKQPPVQAALPTTRLAAVAVRSVNVRIGPSETAAIVSTLRRDTKVTVIEERGKWTLVGLPRKDGHNRPEQGWIYGSNLKMVDAGNDMPDAVKHS